jgi:hypothetical protein
MDIKTTGWKFSKKQDIEPGLVIHICNPTTWEAEASLGYLGKQDIYIISVNVLKSYLLIAKRKIVTLWWRKLTDTTSTKWFKFNITSTEINWHYASPYMFTKKDIWFL